MLRAGTILALLLAAGCQTTIRFQNDIPGARVEQARWVPDGSQDSFMTDDVLQPGDRSGEISIHQPKYEGAKGRIFFELAVRGDRVALVTEEMFSAVTGDNTTFHLKNDTPVFNPSLELVAAAESEPDPAE